MLNADFPGQVHLRIENKWLTDYAATEAYADCRHLDSTDAGRQMRPRGILVGYNGADTTQATATVHGVLWEENHNQADTYTLAVGVVHPIAFKFIYAQHTNGRDIKIYG
jgi:hypothetical protein